MPDDTTIASAEPSQSDTSTATQDAPSTGTDSATAESKPSSDDIYDQVATEVFAEDADDDKVFVEASKPAPESAAPAPEASKAQAITESEVAVLKRAGYEDDEFKDWDRQKIEAKVAKLRPAQAEQDRIGSEYARLKKSGEQPKPEEKDEAKPESKAEFKPPAGKFGERLAQARAKAIEDYDEGIAPVFDLVADLASRNEALEQQQSVVPLMAELMGEVILESAARSLETKYPSLNKPEARGKVMERFWAEFNSGAYSKPGVSIRQQMASALENAAKVTFLNVTENTAVANLVTANKARVAGQPKAPSGNARKQPLTRDDIYDQAYQETLGKDTR